jgi:hypothetical protein
MENSRSGVSDVESPDRLCAAFPRNLSADVVRVSEVLRIGRATSLSPDDVGSFVVVGETISIPYRVYFDEPSEADRGTLTELQCQVLCCLLTRHTDGFVRQRSVTSLLSSIRAWTAPFVFALIGEYVVEIIEAIEAALTTRGSELLREVAASNPGFAALTRRRVISYWDCYYRGRYRFADYPGFRVLRTLEAWPDDEARDLRCYR